MDNPRIRSEPSTLVSEPNKIQQLRKQRKYRIPKNRNDHSIQKKSPIRLPEGTPKKPQLTFRINTQHNEINRGQTKRNVNNKADQQISVSRMSTGSKISSVSMKDNVNNQVKSSIRLEEYDLIDHLWETTIQLGNFNNPLFSKFIAQLQNTIREMIKSFAYAKMDEDVLALASSQKIKLQNFLMTSNYEKDNHKEYQYEDSRVSEELNQPSNSSKTKQSQENTVPDSQISGNSNKASPKEQTQELQLKKILYMIEGKSRTGRNSIRGHQNYGSGKKPQNIYYESYSSFNQNPSEDSGYTIMQIDKQNDNLDLNSLLQEEQSSECSQISVKSSYNNCSGRHSTKNENSSKRKVLQDIIGMLNKKYNKNIQLN